MTATWGDYRPEESLRRPAQTLDIKDLPGATPVPFVLTTEGEDALDEYREQSNETFRREAADMAPARSILTEARDLVRGARQAAYDHPYCNHDRIARIWSVILGIEVTPEQAALCMLGVKIAREAYRPGRDNRVDMAGYADVLDLIVQRRAELESKE